MQQTRQHGACEGALSVMKKKHVFAACVALAVVSAHSCRMPPSIEIRADNVGFSIPVGIGANIAEIVRNAISEDLNVRVFDMVARQDAQAFLLAFELDMLPSFNPGDYLDMGGMDDMGNFGIDPIEARIAVPQIVWEPVEVEVTFEMESLFYTMEKALNDNSMPKITIPSLQLPLFPMPYEIFLPPQLQDIPEFFAVTFDGDDANFDSILLSTQAPYYENNILLSMSLEPALNLPAGLVVQFRGIQMVGARTGNPIGPEGTPPLPIYVELRHNGNGSFSGENEIDLNGFIIDRQDPPKFRFGSIWSGGTNSPGLPEVSLVIDARLDRIALKGATGLRIGSISHDLPQDIIDNILIDAPDEFLNARISSGTFSITAKVEENLPCGTFGSGMQIKTVLPIEQENATHDGQTFPGLDAVWRIDADAPFSLGGSTINRRDININPAGSFLEVESGPSGISFVLEGEHYANKTLPVIVNMSMSISDLEWVHWKLTDDLIPTHDFEIDFDGMGITDFVESITFNEITVGINLSVPDALDGIMALSITSAPTGTPPSSGDLLGFPGVSDPLRRGSDNFIRAEPGAPLNLAQTPVITVKIDAVPVISGAAVEGNRYLRLGRIFFEDGADETVIELLAEITVDFDWKEAAINIGQLVGDQYLSGGIPDEPIELGGMIGEYMRGFAFAPNSLDIGLFLEGPVDIIEKIQPTLRLWALFDDTDVPGYGDDPLIEIDRSAWTGIDLGFPDLPDDTGIWPHSTLPPNGLGGIDADGFIKIFADMPDYLRFAYDIELGYQGTITITRDMFDDVGDDSGGAIRALVVMKVALDFTADADYGAAFSLFDSDGDLFGRDDADEPFFGDDSLSINAIRLRLDFHGSIFQGAVLHVDSERNSNPGSEDILFGSAGLPIGDAHGMEVAITGRDWSIINERLIIPDISIEYPPGASLRIPRNPLPTRLTISVSGSYTLSFND